MSYALDIRKHVMKARENANSVAFNVTAEIGKRLVERSPVGNKELWAINDIVHLKRETLQVFLEEHGKKRKSNRAIKKLYPTKGATKYVGGHFRANWQYSEATAASGNPYDEGAASYPSAGAVTAALIGSMKNDMAGKVHYYTNNVVYAQRLEEGWSQQAPQGMVGLVVAEFQGIVSDAARGVSGS